MAKSPHNPLEDEVPEFDKFDEQFAQSLYGQSPPDNLLNKILSIPTGGKEAKEDTRPPPAQSTEKKPKQSYDPWSFSFLKVAAVLVFIFAIASLMDPQNVEAESTLERFAHAYLVKGPPNLKEQSARKEMIDKWLEEDSIQQIRPHLTAMGFTMEEYKTFKTNKSFVYVLRFNCPEKASLWLFFTPSTLQEDRLLVNKPQMSLISWKDGRHHYLLVGQPQISYEDLKELNGRLQSLSPIPPQ